MAAVGVEEEWKAEERASICALERDFPQAHRLQPSRTLTVGGGHYQRGFLLVMSVHATMLLGFLQCWNSPQKSFWNSQTQKFR